MTIHTNTAKFVEIVLHSVIKFWQYQLSYSDCQAWAVASAQACKYLCKELCAS